MEQINIFSNARIKIDDINLFRDIAIEASQLIAFILKDCPIVNAQPDEVVLDAHSTGARLYIVLTGALAVKSPINHHNNHNKPNAEINKMGHIQTMQYLPGECVGEISVLDEEVHSATIIASVESTLLVIEAEIMWRLIKETHGVARNLLQLLSFRIRAANAQIRNRQKVGEFYRQLSMVDGLTGLHNRAWLNSQLPTLVESAHASKKPLSIIMVDLDHFKHFNDEYGHILGDDALQVSAKVLNAGLRPTDFAARYGGEEMIIILPNTTHRSALVVAERLCARLRKAEIFLVQNKPLPHITASFGMATLSAEQTSIDLIAAADAALYRAKDSGRNRVCA